MIGVMSSDVDKAASTKHGPPKRHHEVLHAPSLRDRVRHQIPAALPDLSPIAASVASVVEVVGGNLNPKGDPGICDRNPLDRFLNVLTSVPFIAVGLSQFRRRSSPEGKAYSASLLAVGASAIAYHSAPPGRAKSITRRLDYWSVEAACCYLAVTLRQSMGDEAVSPGPKQAVIPCLQDHWHLQHAAGQGGLP